MAQRVRILLTVGALACATTRPAQAAACLGSEEPALQLLFEGPFDPKLAQAMARDLRAGLSDRELRVCLDSSADSSLVARISLRPNADGSITIEVDDRLTNKRVLREVSVRREADGTVVDADGLTLSVAIEELLRATWAELELGTARGPRASQTSTSAAAEAAPTEGARSESGETRPQGAEPPASASPTPARRGSALHLGLGARALVALAHQPTWGGFAFVSTRLGTAGLRQGIDATLSLGGQWGQAPASANGQVRVTGLGGDLLLCLPLLGAAGFSLGPSLGSSLHHWTFSPTAEPAVEARSARGWVWLALAGLRASHDWNAQRLGLDLLGGAALVGLDVTDGTRKLAGWSGPVLDGRLHWGLSW